MIHELHYNVSPNQTGPANLKNLHGAMEREFRRLCSAKLVLTFDYNLETGIQKLVASSGEPSLPRVYDRMMNGVFNRAMAQCRVRRVKVGV